MEGGTRETVVISVPDLTRRPLPGGGCCAVASAWLIEETLTQLAGVERVHTYDERGRVAVTLGPEGAKVEEIWAALETLGFPPVN